MAKRSCSKIACPEPQDDLTWTGEHYTLQVEELCENDYKAYVVEHPEFWVTAESSLRAMEYLGDLLKSIAKREQKVLVTGQQQRKQ